MARSWICSQRGGSAIIVLVERSVAPPFHNRAFDARTGSWSKIRNSRRRFCSTSIVSPGAARLSGKTLYQPPGRGNPAKARCSGRRAAYFGPDLDHLMDPDDLTEIALDQVDFRI